MDRYFKQALYLDNWLHVLDHVRHSAVVLHSHVGLDVDVGFMTEGWDEVDALGLAVDHLGHFQWCMFVGRGRCGTGSSKGDSGSQQKEDGLGDGNHV